MKQAIGILCLAMLMAALWASTCSAAEGETTKVQGTVSVTKEADAIKSVQLTTDTDTYNIELDENGLALGEMDGLQVEVEGTVTVPEKDGPKWLKVSSFTEVVEEETK
jgi:archaellum component FlaF (FlaF/FlaG flagellin family)